MYERATLIENLFIVELHNNQVTKKRSQTEQNLRINRFVFIWQNKFKFKYLLQRGQQSSIDR